MTTQETYEGKPCRIGHTLRLKRSNECVECKRIYNKEFHQKRIQSGLSDKRYKFMVKYGYPIELFQSIPKHCQICGKEGLLNLDHDHTTGKFRGWLCGHCNKALGFVSDDIELLQKLIDYLKLHKASR